ncbi:hypothetical protein HBI80_116270 [Parastagonospora nodorum]|nr:hypothetical protein HBI80_116270 [Parastagonospora nodorum]KAH5334980.1 hypothetical protein HBI12_040150 [Parastagonospora nodorum]KAH5417280.1 hypothetical protein HBI47_143920 [Parastagonospora nodorum]
MSAVWEPARRGGRVNGAAGRASSCAFALEYQSLDLGGNLPALRLFALPATRQTNAGPRVFFMVDASKPARARP